ncbi:MAG: lysophospholipid acyltransferase family protein [Bacteroidetes bacterium]|nr:lysophospholipid acyltransferase family protein [Bacteroidota bacterium]
MAKSRIKQKILQRAGLLLIHPIITVLIWTLRVRVINQDSLEVVLKNNTNYVLAFWHGTMLLPWHKHKASNFSALVSQSKDGEILSTLLRKWKYKVVRGSSNVGGKEALGLMIEEINNGKCLAITPDGPTGPSHKMKAGAVVAAKKANVPLVLLGVYYHDKYILKSWDKFEIPKFFSKVSLLYSSPIFIDRELDFEGTSNIISKCETELNNLQELAKDKC